MSGSIRLHPEHGVNPTLPVCFWCGKETGEVALLGAAYRGEAPKNLILNYVPCPSCAEKQAKGITIIEADPRDGDPKPTGRWVVIAEAAVERLFQPEVLVQAVLKSRKAFMEPAAFQQVFADVITETGGDKPS